MVDSFASPRRRGGALRYRVSVAPAASGILWGWKQIASYLQVSVRQAHAWHAARPMPLVRIGPSNGVPKLALDRWLLERPLVERGVGIPRSPHLRRVVQGAMAEEREACAQLADAAGAHAVAAAIRARVKGD